MHGRKRDLTVFGKITVIKMLAIPKLILIAQTTAHRKDCVLHLYGESAIALGVIL